MNMMGTTISVLLYVAFSFVFIISFTSICYELSPYSRREGDVSLPEWERKALYTIAGYPPLSLLLLAILAVILPNWYSGSAQQLHIMVWFCTGHMLLSVMGGAGAWYLRRRNRRNTVYFVTDLFAGCIYACTLIGLFLYVYR